MTSHESVLVQTVVGLQYMLVALTFMCIISFMQQTALVNLSPDDEGYVWFKFEPFVLHLMCRTLEDAQHMVSAASPMLIIRLMSGP